MILNASEEDAEKSQVKQYFVNAEGLKGAIIPSANFEPLPIAIAAEKAAITLSHVGHNALHRTMRLDEDRFSGLSRYLAGPENPNGHAFGATEDAMVSVYAELCRASPTGSTAQRTRSSTSTRWSCCMRPRRST